MNIKQTIIMLSISVIAMTTIVIFPQQVEAAKCAGVDTALISCSQGACDNGVQPFEGNDPRTDEAKKTEYKTKYGHMYGKCDAAGQVAADMSEKNNGVWGLLLLVLNIMTAGVGILAVGGIVYGAVLYTTAADKAEQTKKAIGIITNVVIGIVAYGLMFLVLNFLIPGGIFTV